MVGDPLNLSTRSVLVAIDRAARTDGDVRGADDQSARTVGVGEPDAHALAAEARVYDLPHRLPVDLDGCGNSLRAGAPRADPVGVVRPPVASNRCRDERWPARTTIRAQSFEIRIDEPMGVLLIRVVPIVSKGHLCRLLTAC